MYMINDMRAILSNELKCVQWISTMHIGVFHKNSFLDIDMACCWLFVLGPLQTDVRKCILPKSDSFPLN